MIYWDPKPEIFIVPYLHWPISWYGLLFMLGFALGVPIFASILRRFFSFVTKYTKKEINQKASFLADRIIVYILIGTIVGARVGHFLFYEDPSVYWEMFTLQNGGLHGLSSHGAAIGIAIALLFYRLSIREKFPKLTILRLIDYVCIPVILCGAFIRIGNFINQEILGSQTVLPWGVIFGHPADNSPSVPRHPVQIYEALFYALVFWLLWYLSHKPKFLLKEGMLSGLFFILVFGFRILVEFVKLEQSELIHSSLMTMGQILSIPIVLVGVFLMVRAHKKTQSL
jgi:phosphatidylglycerol---prolipoprotein diacylglyceryl transferase